MVAIADIPDDHLATVNADTEADRLAQVMTQELIQFVDVGSDHRRCPEGLPAGLLPAGRESKQRQHAVTDELVGPAAAFHHRLGYRAEETVDDEDRVERKSLFRKPGRAAHVHEQADEIALLPDPGRIGAM